MDSVTPLPAPALCPDVAFVGMSEAQAALDTAVTVASRLWVREAGLPMQAIPLLRRAEGFLVAARFSAVAGRWQAAGTFGRIAEAEFMAITRSYAELSASTPRALHVAPHVVFLTRVSPDGPL